MSLGTLEWIEPVCLFICLGPPGRGLRRVWFVVCSSFSIERGWRSLQGLRGDVAQRLREIRGRYLFHEMLLLTRTGLLAVVPEVVEPREQVHFPLFIFSILK